MNNYIAIILLVFPPFISLAAETVECQGLQWKLEVTGSPGNYRGAVKAGSVDVIHIEVRNTSGYKLIGQGMGFPNLDGSWKIIIWADYNLKESHKVRFYCEKY